MSSPRLDQPFITGVLKTPAGDIPVVSSSLTLSDCLGTVKVRCGLGRNNYQVDAGLYALGNPDSDSEILVTSNYKLTFDIVRKSLANRSLWLLVLDTGGVNVWCAAGKGTFGTDELLRRIASSALHLLVRHRRLIAPQLGAPGISAHEVRKKSGFKIIFGPVDCRDITSFLDNGRKATSAMRFKSFDVLDRAVLIPVELFHALKYGLLLTMLSVIISGLLGNVSFWNDAMTGGLFFGVGLFAAILGGAILSPIFLPWLPGRSFSTKGFIMGTFIASICLLVRYVVYDNQWSWLEVMTWFLVITSVTSYLTLNFTGSSTFTSLSGVRKEMRWAFPVQLFAGICGSLTWFGLILTK